MYEHPRSTQEVLDEADGMGVSLLEAAAMRAPELLQEEGGMGSSTGLAPLGSSTTSSSRSGGGAALAAKEGEDAAAGGGLPLWAGDLVAAKLAEAAAMASAVALQPLASAAGSLYSSGLGLVAGAFAAQQAGGNAASAERLAVATLATVTAVEASVAPHPAGGSHLAAQGEQGACPSEWFVADAAVQGVRYFVIQGSDSLDHWKTNLTFDPVVFEDARLGVKVHRGVYEAAEALYARYLPLVQEWVDTQPAAQVCFIVSGAAAGCMAREWAWGINNLWRRARVHAAWPRLHWVLTAARVDAAALCSASLLTPSPLALSSPQGHSIGGSMATLLMMMYRLRGVLTPHQIAPSVTFGAPAVFVDGSAGHCNCGGSAPDCHVCNGAGAAGASAAAGSQVAGVAQQGLLRGLGLRESHVINVTMARDIVPRAFTCDYSLVADLLRTWGPGFKAHCCLAREGRKHLYHFVGRVLVLQPSEALRFAGPEPRHPMLPAASDLLLLAAPAGGGLVAEMRTAAQRAATLREGGCCSASEPGSVTEAVWALMDNPHPLDILGGAGSYGNDGAISRYHNPDNYTRALGRLCAERRAAAHKALLAPPRVPALAAQRLQLGGTLTAAGAQQSAAQSAGC